MTDLLEEHECSGCGLPTSGTFIIRGSKTALCEECLDRQRWDNEGGAQHIRQIEVNQDEFGQDD